MLAHLQEKVPFKIVPAIITVLFLIFMLMIPCPQGLTPNAWALVGIFFAVILGIILKVMSIGVMSLVAIVAICITQVTVTPKPQEYVADGQTKTFTVDGGFTSGDITVFVKDAALSSGNGVVIDPVTKTITFDQAPPQGAKITFTGSAEASSDKPEITQQYVANGVAKSFTVDSAFTSGAITVFVKDAALSSGKGVDFDSGKKFTFEQAPAEGAKITFTGVNKPWNVSVKNALSSFSNELIWLIVISIMVSKGLKKTGLGARIGYLFIRLLGKKTLGIGYGLAICELFLAPVMPSNTARGGGTINPITRSIAMAFGSDPEKGTQGKIGTYLSLVNYHANPITSGMFLTATAPNPLVLNYVNQVAGTGLHLTWSSWALYMLLPGLVAILLMPLVIYLISPPEVKSTPNAVSYAKEQMSKLGGFNRKECIMLATFIVMLLLWANAPAALLGALGVDSGVLRYFQLNATSVAALGLAMLLFTGILTWDDVLTEKSAWDTLFWFGALVMMADQLNKTGVIKWFSVGLQAGIEQSGLGWMTAAAVLVLVFMYSHYVFASTTAHISAMMLAFLSVGAVVIPAEYLNIFLLMMVAASTIMMGLTHYATGTSPVIFGSGYVTMGRWWGVGFVMSVVNIVIWLVVGLLWWRILGLWPTEAASALPIVPAA